MAGSLPSTIAAYAPQRRPAAAGAAIAGLLLLAGAPLILSSYALGLLTMILIYGVFAMSQDLLMGYAGLASFGHAAFFGVGSYAAGLVGLHVSNSLWLTLPAAIAVSAVLAAVIGSLAIRAGGIYFLMLTLALSQLVHTYAVSVADFAGGSNGLPGLPRPSLSPLPTLIDFWKPTPFYYLTLIFAVGSFLFLRTVIASPFGRSLIGIRENETRMQALGYWTWRYKLAAFAIAGAVAGAAGAFYAYKRGFTSPDLLDWPTSGLAIVFVIIGGAGTLVGPMLGAALYLVLQDVVSSYTQWWQVILGVSFILIVYSVPRGIVGLTRRLWR